MKLLNSILFAGLVMLSAGAYADSKTTIKPIAVTADGQKIIAYFSEQVDGKSTTITSPRRHGYYRILLGQDNKGYLVQDFYQDTGNKQTNPFYIQDKKDLTDSFPSSNTGELNIYDIDGNIISKVFFDQHHIITQLSNYAANGQLLYQSHYDSATTLSKDKYWYSNGQVALDIASYNFDEVLEVQAWYKNGKLIDPKRCFIDKSLNLDHVQPDKCTLLYQQIRDQMKYITRKNIVLK